MVWRAGDPIIFRLIVNDTLTVVGISAVLTKMMDNLRVRLIELEIKHEQNASRFLGPVVSEAIFKMKSSI